jgi:hypothetical protein
MLANGEYHWPFSIVTAEEISQVMRIESASE